MSNKIVYLMNLALLGILLLSCGFGYAKEEGRKITFRDDFNGFDRATWQIGGEANGVSCHDGMLKLKASGGLTKGITLSSVTLYSGGNCEMRVRFSKLGRGSFYYLGFFNRNPWGNDCAWLMNCETATIPFLVTKDRKGPKEWAITTGLLKENQWYTFKIVWVPPAADGISKADTLAAKSVSGQQYAELFVDGVSHGKIVDAEFVPSTAIPMVFDVSSKDDEIEMDIDWVVIQSEAPETSTTTPVAVPLPIQAKRRVSPLAEQAPRVTLSAGAAVLENQYYRYELSLNHGPVITALINKYIGGNLIDGQSRLFLMQQGTNVLSNDGYKLLAASVEQSGPDRILHITYQAREAPVELALSLKVDGTPELSCGATIKNQGGKEKIFGVTYPILEHLKIGNKVEDDLYFYPMESGVCGGLSADLRSTYGFVNWMQVMAVFDPVAGGGIYTFTKDRTGYPKVMLLRKKVAGVKPVEVSIVYAGQDPGAIFDNQSGSAMAFRHLEYQLKPGETASLPETVVGVHQGVWHDPLRNYSTWAHTWFKKEYPTPQWYMDSYTLLSGHRFSGLHLLTVTPDTSGFWDTKKHEFSYARQMGVKEINSVMEFAFWSDNPPNISLNEVFEKSGGAVISFFKIGDYNYSPEIGGLPALREEIRRIHEKQGRFLLYTFYNACWEGTQIGQAHGKEWAIMDAPGKYRHDYLGPDEGWNICPYIAGWRDYFTGTFARIIGETGADGYRLDTAPRLIPCFNPRHDHYNGTFRSAVSPEAMAKFLIAAKRAACQSNPENVCTTEHGSSDYLMQFSDGNFSENMSWVGDPKTNIFQNLNQYRLSFTRFYFPEAKTTLHGIEPRSELGIPMGLFNACPPMVMPADGALAFDAIRENGDAVNSLIPPEPYVDTLLEHVYANYFPGKEKNLWTVWNRSGKTINQPLLEVPFRKDVHYVEVLNDLPVKAESKGGVVALSAPIKENEVICIVEVPVVLSAKVTGNLIEVSTTASGDCTLQVAGAMDQPGNRQIVTLTDGKASFKKTGKTVIKLMKDYYLVDEIIIE